MIPLMTKKQQMADVLACCGLPAQHLPENLAPEHHAIFASYCQWPRPAMEMKCLHRVAVSSTGLIYHWGHWLMESLPHYFEPDHGEANKMRTLIKTRPVRRFLRHHFFSVPVFAAPRAFWCSDLYSGSYYHWIIETLPRIHLATLAEEHPVVYLPAPFGLLSFVQESLPLFPEVDFRLLKWRQTLWAGQLNWISPMGYVYQLNPKLIHLLRERITKALEPSGRTGKPVRLHASRRKAGKRKLLNEDEVEKCLMARGFQTVYFEEMTLRQQMEICARAEALVGIHGAGLANALFLPGNARVVEMQMFQSWPSCYFRLCNALELKYHYLYCRHFPPDETSELAADLEVDVGQLQALLDSAGLT